LPRRVRVNIATADVPDGLVAGARVRLRARLMPPADAAVPGGYDFAMVAWFSGIGATGRALQGVEIVAPARKGDVSLWLASLRGRLSQHIQASLPGATGGFAVALATGDQGALPEVHAEGMRGSGLAHLLSVSGLHVTAMVGATMLIVLRLLALSPWLALRAPLPLIAAAAAALMGIVYTLLTGAEVPTIRSCVAALLVLGGIAIGREAITLRLVATGALFVLILWPEALAGPSFQLSFAAVTAIVALAEHPRARQLFARADESRLRRFGRGLAALLATGIVVEIALMPIALYHFHKAGLYGALANIVAIPLTTFVIMPLEALALALDVVGLGAPAWWLTGQSAELLLWTADAASSAPGAVQTLPAMPPAAFALMVAGGIWIGLWRSQVRRAGVILVAAGAFWALRAPAPDLLITGDGRHLAVRSEDGSLALLRPRAGDYVRDVLGENAGVAGEASELDTQPGTRCGPDLCRSEILRGGRRWRLLATRSPYLVDIGEMNRACAAADIVVSDRRLPRTCRPRWLKADRPFLARTGGLAISLSGPAVRTVHRPGDQHPWRISSGGGDRPGGPARGPDRGRSAGDRSGDWPDRGAPSRLRGANI
jgi:competence protein ComEC